MDKGLHLLRVTKIVWCTNLRLQDACHEAASLPPFRFFCFCSCLGASMQYMSCDVQIILCRKRIMPCTLCNGYSIGYPSRRNKQCDGRFVGLQPMSGTCRYWIARWTLKRVGFRSQVRSLYASARGGKDYFCPLRVVPDWGFASLRLTLRGPMSNKQSSGLPP